MQLEYIIKNLRRILESINNPHVKSSIEKYENFVTAILIDAKQNNENARKRNPSLSEYTDKEMKDDIRFLIDNTAKNLSEIVILISSKISMLGSKWQGSIVTVEPYFDKKNFSFQPCTDFTIKIGDGRVAPDFTMFQMGQRIDDVLEAGDKDFFTNNETEVDYFLLVQAFEQSHDDPEKAVILYTARPKNHNDSYSGKTIPSNIFLTTSADEAFGYAEDFGNRDVYKIKIQKKYLVKTLERGHLKNYQSVGPNPIPVEDIIKLT